MKNPIVFLKNIKSRYIAQNKRSDFVDALSIAGSKLNVGSGTQMIEGFLNIDISVDCNPDYIWDITKTPWPKEWADDIAAIRMDNLLEHIEPYSALEVIRESYRVLKPGGILWIRVPEVRADKSHIQGAFSDPTHCNFFTPETFDYYDKNHERWKNFGAPDYGCPPFERINQYSGGRFLIVELRKPFEDF